MPKKCTERLTVEKLDKVGGRNELSMEIYANEIAIEECKVICHFENGEVISETEVGTVGLELLPVKCEYDSRFVGRTGLVIAEPYSDNACIFNSCSKMLTL